MAMKDTSELIVTERGTKIPLNGVFEAATGKEEMEGPGPERKEAGGTDHRL